MKRIGDLLRDIRDQAALASGGNLDRPTSLYQAGNVGGGQRAPSQRPAEEPMMDGPGPRQRGREADIDVVPGRRRPQVAPTPVPVSARSLALRSFLATPNSLRTAIVIGEVLGPPISMRADEQRRDFRSSVERDTGDH